MTNIKYEYSSNKKDLIIYKEKDDKGNFVESITLKNFASKDVTNNATKKTENTSSVILTDGTNPDVNLREDLYLVDGSKIVTAKSFTGTWLDEEIDATSAPAGKKNKGVTIKGMGGDDKITGSAYNDTITGGTGENTILYSKGSGNDVINLTKGENFTLKLTDIDSINELKFDFVKNDLRIYTDLDKYNDEDKTNDEYITIKNFVAKDVTNNGNAKKGIEDESSVELLLKDSATPIDLREYLYQRDTEKNYTGSWLNEDISAEEYKRYTDKKKTIVDEDVTKKGLTLNGKDGDDEITGSNYSDTIKGGNGDDTIKGGTGNDQLYGEAGKNTFVFEVGHGKDTVYAGKGEDTIVFKGVEYINSIDPVKKGSKDAVISYGDKKDTVTLKNFYTIDKKGNVTGMNTSVKYIKTDYQQICVSSKADDVFELTEYGGGFADRLHTTILAGANSSDALVLNDESFPGNDGNFYFVKDGNDFKIWYNVDDDLKNTIEERGVQTYKGSEINNINGTVYTSSITIKDYFVAENPIDKFIINDEEYSIFDYYTNKIDIDALVDAGEFEEGGTFHATKWNDKIDTVKGLSDEGEIVYAGDGDDYIGSWGRRDSYYGENGDDTIYINENGVLADGGNGEDEIEITATTWHEQNPDGVRIIGGKDNDTLKNELGCKAIFEFKKGDGQDTLTSISERDIIKFTDCDLSEVTIEKGTGNDVLVKYGESDVITVKDALKNLAKIMVEDQTGEELNLLEQFNIFVGDGEVTGTDDNDTIYGRDGADVLIGGTGDDLLIGQKGSDTYEFNIGDGIDTIVNGNNTEIDSIKFNDITDVRNLEFNIANNEKDLVISYGNNDKVIVQNYFELGNTVKKFIVKDENEVSGFKEYDIATDNNHTIDDTYSASVTGTIFNDYIKVNALNKSIAGGEGANTYVITADDVARTITTTSGRDIIEFTDIDLSDLTFDKEGSDVTIKGTGVNITLKNYFVNLPELLVSDGTTTKNVIQQLESAGIIYSNEESFAGTEGAEQLFGGDSANTITSGKGDDIINAGKGNDTLVFAIGDGKDTIINGTEANEVDTIKFDVTIDKLTYKKDGDNLVIGYIDNDTDSVTVKDYYKSSNTVKKFIVKDENEVSGFKEYDIEKDLKNNIHATSTTVSGTEYNDRIWGTDGDDTIIDTQGSNEFIGGKGADTYKFTSYGNGFADRRHDTIIMGADSVADTIVFNDEDNYHINSGYFNFVREGNNLRIWYNLDSTLSDNQSLVNHDVTNYNGSEVYKDWSSVYCSSLTIKDYFLSTAENCTIDKLVINDEEYSIIDIVSNSIDLDSLVAAGELEDGGTYHATRFNDDITTRRGLSDEGEKVYGGDGDDFIRTWGRRDSYYGEQGNDTIYINENGVLADGGVGDDEITVTETYQRTQNPDGVRVIGGEGNDVLTDYANAKVIFEFETGHGTDIINYKGGNDVIKFTDVEITDITFGEYDLENQTLTLSYGTSGDSITINGLSTDRNTVKIEDKTGTQYTVIIGDGDNNIYTVQKPNADENAVFISSTGRDSFDGNTGINVFANCNGYDGTVGETNGTNIFIITPEENASIYAKGQSDKIILKDLELSQLNYEFEIDGDGTVKITNTVNNQEITLFNFASYKVNPTIVAKDGQTTILDELPIIFPEGLTLDGTETEGISEQNNILIGSGILDKVDIIVGGKGDDILFGGSGPDIYVFNKGDGNDVLGRNCGDEATLRFNDSTYEELSFKQLSGHKYQVTYNGGADSVIFYNDQVTKFIVKDTTVEGGYKEYSMATDMQQYIKGDGFETDLVGSDIKDIFTGTSINETMTGGEGSNIYNFTTGDGQDTVVISTQTDTINFTDVETGNLAFDINGEDLEIAYGTGTDKVIVKDYMKNFHEIAITGANSTSTTALEGLESTGIVVGSGTINGKDSAETLIAGATDDTITGGKGNDTISGGSGNNTYIFNKGDGNDTINYSTGDDIIKFNDVTITDITYGTYDLNTKSVTLSYGESDTLTINGLSTDRNKVKIEDKTGTQYTVIIGDGDDNIYTVQKPNADENAVFISSTGRDSFDGNTGINVFANCNNLDGVVGSNTTNLFIINSETNASIYAKSDNDKIILKNLELSELKYEFEIDGDGTVKITNTVNSQEVNLFNFTSYRANPTIVDKNGDEVKVLDKIGVIFGDVGTSGNDIISANTDNGEVFGKGGSDVIYASGNYSTIYTYDKDLKNIASGSSVTVDTDGNQTFTIYAQSEENIILNQGYRAKGTYYAYSDQKTSITETSDQTESTDSVLNIMNTDDVNDIDGVHTNLNIVFNVSKDYKTVQGATAIGDVRILDDSNFDNWLKGASYKDITLKNNCIEIIKSSDGYSITSEQIAQLAEDVAGWLTSEGRDYASVNAVLSSDNETDINALTAFFAQDSNWSAPTP